MNIIKRIFAGHRPRRLPWIIAIVVVLLIGGWVGAAKLYNNSLGPVSENQTTQLFRVKKGETVKQISDNLQSAHLIRSAWAFQIYVNGRNWDAKLQAGTYALAPSYGTKAIASILTHGQVSTQLVTILPGRRIDQIRADFINAGFSPTSVDSALDPANYTDLPIMTIKPAGANLEGLLWPDSYQKQPDTDPKTIIRQSLKDMWNQLSPSIKAGFEAHGLSTYQGIILTSIVTQEVNKPFDQAQAAQVFLSRLAKGMVLGSDVTVRYGAIQAGLSPSLSYDSPYNTFTHAGLPPGPISSISRSALDAVAHPASTGWLYFVTGDNGITYFSTNLQDHQNYTQKYCHKLCAQ